MYASKGKKSVTVEVKKEYVEGKTIEIILPGVETNLKEHINLLVNMHRLRYRYYGGVQW